MASFLDFFPQQQPQREDYQQQQQEDDHVDEDEDDEEEALSLCDLPLNHNTTKKCNALELNDTSSRQSRRSSLSEGVEFFEFFNVDTAGAAMCAADDIVFCGRLFNGGAYRSPPKDPTRPPVNRRRSESLSTLQSGVTRSNSATATNTCGSNSRRFLMRNSRSLDYRRLRRNSSSVVTPAAAIERNSSVKSEIAAKKPMRPPRWLFLFFGVVRVPSEMELSDIKNRQFRRNPSTTMFPAAADVAVNRNSGKVSWKILKALSCKDYDSVSVTTPFVTS